MTVTTSTNTTVTITLNDTEKNAIATVAKLFDRISEAIIDNYSGECCIILDAENDVPINVPSDEIGTMAMNLEEFTATKLIQLLSN